MQLYAQIFTKIEHEVNEIFSFALGYKKTSERKNYIVIWMREMRWGKFIWESANREAWEEEQERKNIFNAKKQKTSYIQSKIVEVQM